MITLDYIFLFATLIFLWLAIPKKDEFFIFRAIGIFFSFSILIYSILQFFGLKNNLLVYIISFIFLAATLAIFNRKYRSYKSLFFGFDSKKILLSVVLLVFVSGTGLLYFRGQLLAPRYQSMDASTHFKKVRLILESNDTAADPVYASVFASSKAFFYKKTDIKSILRDFQLFNLFLFSLLSVYFFLIFKKFLPIKSPVLNALVFLLLTFGFFFNLFVMGFLPQAVGLFLLFFFFDLYANVRNENIGKAFIALSMISVFFAYTYWFPIILFFFGFEWLKFFLLSKNRRKNLAFSAVFLLVAVFILLVVPETRSKLQALAKMAMVEGETYKAILSNLIYLLPLFIPALFYLAKKRFLDAHAFVSFYFSAVIFSVALFSTYIFNLSSSYTFTKSFYLTGPVVVAVSIFFLGILLERVKNNLLKFSVTFFVASGILAFIFYPFLDSRFNPKSFEEIQALEKKLNFSLDRKSVFSLEPRPLDIYFFNLEVFLNQDNFRMEYSGALNRTKMNFIEKIQNYLPPDYQKNYAYDKAPKNEMKLYVVADLRTSYWFFELTRIWNPALNDPQTFQEIVFDYDAWKESPDPKYLVIFETQTAQKWLWLNQENFRWEDFDILCQSGQNYLLKLKEKS